MNGELNVILCFVASRNLSREAKIKSILKTAPGEEVQLRKLTKVLRLCKNPTKLSRLVD